MRLNRGSFGWQQGRRRLAAVLSATTGLLTALALALPGPALAASSTTVSPPGDGFLASLHANVTADFTVSGVTVHCAHSSTAGTVPQAPDNHNDNGPVSIPIAPPVFDNGSSAACPTTVPLTRATTTTNSTNGTWQIDIQFGTTTTGTMTIPQASVVTTISGLASCTIVVAPDGPVTIVGTFVSTTTPPQLLFSAVVLPVRVSGGLGCPTAAVSATFSATYDLTDTTDPTRTFTVTA